MHTCNYLKNITLKLLNIMANKVINYRGASTTVNEVQAENSQHAEALQASNPGLTYRGSHSDHAHVTEENQKHDKALREHDPIISYRGSSVRFSEIHG